MCIRIRALGGVQSAEHPVDGDQVGDHLDGLDGLLVCIGPVSDLVEVVADAHQFAGALALDPGVRHGPGASPANRPAHQLRKRQARRARLGVPRRTLHFAGADLHPDGASGAHGAPFPSRGSEGARPPASPCRGPAKRGSKGWAGSSALAGETVPRGAKSKAVGIAMILHGEARFRSCQPPESRRFPKTSRAAPEPYRAPPAAPPSPPAATARGRVAVCAREGDSSRAAGISPQALVSSRTTQTG